MIEHFHHGQRIADFVRDLRREQAERGKFFVLAHLFLDIHDPFIEPRLFDGNGGQIGERGENADFFVREDVRRAGIDAQRADGLPAENQRHAQQRDQSSAPGDVHVLITAGDLNVFHLQRFFAPHHDAEQALGGAEPGFVEVGFAGAVARAEVEPFAGVVQQQQGAHFAGHQLARLAGNDIERVVEVERRVDGLADPDEQFEQAGLEPQLLVEPGIVNDLGGLRAEFLQQLLVFGGEGIELVGVHVEHTAHDAVHFERHGQLRTNVPPRHDVARVLRHIAHSRRFARAGHPASDALAEFELELRRGRRQPARGFDFEKAGGRIEQGHRTAGGAHQLNRLVHDELQRLVRLECGMNDVADLIEQVEPFVAGFEIGQFVAHRFMRQGFMSSAGQVFRPGTAAKPPDDRSA